MTGAARGAAGTLSRSVLGMHVDHIEFAAASRLLLDWAQAAPAHSRYVCAANVHMVMEAHDDAAFRDGVNNADLVVPDGVPLVWALRVLGLPQRRRVRVTPDLLLDLFAACELHGVRMGLYGGAAEALDAFVSFLEAACPDLQLPYAWSPPFRPLSAEEDARCVQEIREAGVQFLLVGLGCPKQERWMAAHAGRLPCLMLGVGAAFDMFAGRTRNAPEWMRDRGLEWTYRLASEPRRLWRRHVLNDPRFLVLLARQALRARSLRAPGPR